MSTASLFREVHKEDREKALHSHPRGTNEDVWAIPSAGEAAYQHRLLVGVVFGNQVTFTPCDQQFHSSVYTQGKCMHRGARDVRQDDGVAVRDGRGQRQRGPRNPKHACTDWHLLTTAKVKQQQLPGA